REPPYPSSNFRGDFLVNGALVEYFGLTGEPEYDLKTKEKLRICAEAGVALIAIYPSDLANSKKLDNKLRSALAPADK
ncbi:MAG: hypothetical protein RI936_1059, partial [Pseudomonadota bacterium]